MRASRLDDAPVVASGGPERECRRRPLQDASQHLALGRREPEAASRARPISEQGAQHVLVRGKLFIMPELPGRHFDLLTVLVSLGSKLLRFALGRERPGLVTE